LKRLARKLQYYLYYIRNASPIVDVRILLTHHPNLSFSSGQALIRNREKTFVFLLDIDSLHKPTMYVGI